MASKSVIKQKRPTTYENEVLGALAYEFSFSDKAEIEAKIKGRLKRKKLGAYDPERIQVMRRLKDELQVEIGKHEISAYFTGYHGKYADMQDFDVERITKKMINRYPGIPKEEIKRFVPFCVLLYYLL